MNKKTMAITGLALGAVGGAALYLEMNKNMRNKAKKMIEMSTEEVKDYFNEM